MILERKEWKEYHPNGQLLITGEIGIVANLWKQLYDCRTGFAGLGGVPVCRLGKWTKYFDNGQEAWTLDYSDGKIGCEKPSFPQYRKDGSIIT